jgi:hypothetical protein
MAEISGVWDNTGGAFQVFVVDNGQGAAAEDDAVTVTQLTTPTCDDDFPDDEDQTALARGNAQVYDAP